MNYNFTFFGEMLMLLVLFLGLPISGKVETCSVDATLVNLLDWKTLQDGKTLQS